MKNPSLSFFTPQYSNRTPIAKNVERGRVLLGRTIAILLLGVTLGNGYVLF
jgi:hypothetical protein